MSFTTFSIISFHDLVLFIFTLPAVLPFSILHLFFLDSHTDRGSGVQCLDLEMGENQAISKRDGPSAPLMLRSLIVYSSKGSRAPEDNPHPCLGYVNTCTDSFLKLWEITHFLGSTILPSSHSQTF